MKLKELLTGISVLECTADPELEIKEIFYDSRKVTPGSLFVAVSGFAAAAQKSATLFVFLVQCVRLVLDQLTFVENIQRVPEKGLKIDGIFKERQQIRCAAETGTFVQLCRKFARDGQRAFVRRGVLKAVQLAEQRFADALRLVRLDKHVRGGDDRPLAQGGKPLPRKKIVRFDLFYRVPEKVYTRGVTEYGIHFEDVAAQGKLAAVFHGRRARIP